MKPGPGYVVRDSRCLTRGAGRDRSLDLGEYTSLLGQPPHRVVELVTHDTRRLGNTRRNALCLQRPVQYLGDSLALHGLDALERLADDLLAVRLDEPLKLAVPP